MEKAYEEMTPAELAAAIQAGRGPSDDLIGMWQRANPRLWGIAAQLAADPEYRGRVLRESAPAARQHAAPAVAPAHDARALLEAAGSQPGAAGVRRFAKAIYGDDGRLIGVERVDIDAATGEPIALAAAQAAAPAPKLRDAEPDDPEKSRKPASIGFVMKMLKQIMGYIREDREVINALGDRVDALEAGGVTMQQPGTLLYRGTYSDDTDYPAGVHVTHQGALWLSLQPSRGLRPGVNREHWRLIVKSGDAPR